MGIIEKEDEPEYNRKKTYKILDYGSWKTDMGDDGIAFTHEIETEDDLKNYLEIRGNEISFKNDIENSSVFLELQGYGEDPADHQVTVLNRKSGAGVTITVDKPLARMAFWACETTLCPENSIWISVQPGQQDSWTSTYTLFVK